MSEAGAQKEKLDELKAELSAMRCRLQRTENQLFAYKDQCARQALVISRLRGEIAGGELPGEMELLEERLRHLLQSEIVRLYDEKNPATHEYKHRPEVLDAVFSYAYAKVFGGD